MLRELHVELPTIGVKGVPGTPVVDPIPALLKDEHPQLLHASMVYEYEVEPFNPVSAYGEELGVAI